MLMCAPYNGGYIEKKVSTGRDCSPERLLAEWEDFLAELPFSARWRGGGGSRAGGWRRWYSCPPCFLCWRGSTASDFGRKRFPSFFSTMSRRLLWRRRPGMSRKRQWQWLCRVRALLWAFAKTAFLLKAAAALRENWATVSPDTPDGIQPFCRALPVAPPFWKRQDVLRRNWGAASKRRKGGVGAHPSGKPVFWRCRD